MPPPTPTWPWALMGIAYGVGLIAVCFLLVVEYALRPALAAVRQWCNQRRFDRLARDNPHTQEDED